MKKDKDDLWIWLDDIRTPPSDDWTWCKTAEEALAKISFSFYGIWGLKRISFDHDLGENKATGYQLAEYIENQMILYRNQCEEYDSCCHDCTAGDDLQWSVHSANPIGKKKIIEAMKSVGTFIKGGNYVKI